MRNETIDDVPWLKAEAVGLYLLFRVGPFVAYSWPLPKARFDRSGNADLTSNNPSKGRSA